MNIMFTERGSVIFLYAVIIISALAAGVGGYLRRGINKYLGKTFILISFLVLLIPLGFRKVGIDHDIYVEWFENADYWLVRNYHMTPEPLFAGLTLFANKILNNFQIIYFAAALVYLAGIYTFLTRTDCFGLISVFFFNVAIYLYMCGLTRISIALGIMAVGYTHIDNTKRYLLYVILATLFHYSSVISLIVLFSYKSKKRFAIKNVLFIVAGVFILSYVINRFADRLPYAIARYASYVQFSFSLSNITSCAILLPAMMVWFLFQKEYAALYGRQFRLYDNLMKTLIILVCLSMFFNGTFRLTFFYYPFIAKVYFDFSRVLKRIRGSGLRIAYPAAFMLVGIVYVYAVFLTSPFITHLIVPFGM